MVTSKIIFKIKKPKIIHITNNDYKELTCFIFVTHNLNINSNKQIKLGLFKLFFYNTSFLILHNKYDYSDIKPLFNTININRINRLYNRNRITIYVLTIDFGLKQININNNIYNEKKYVLFLEKNLEDYRIITKQPLNSHLNNIFITPYFSITLKYIIGSIWNY